MPCTGIPHASFCPFFPDREPGHDADLVDGFDYDIGARLLRNVAAVDESELLTVLRDWQLDPSSFLYAWDTADPR